jgi:heterotetrameric sarcosine oxidase gamma subunit
MSLDFLSPDLARRVGAGPVARSPLERCLRAAGARFEVRDGWSVAMGLRPLEAELDTCRGGAGVADRSALGKLELQGVLPVELEPGIATRTEDAWWCPLTPERALVLAAPAATGALRRRLEQDAQVVDVTTNFGALAVLGPLAREVLARLTALDLRPQRMPEGGFRPGSVARVPGMVLREQGDRFLVLFGATHAEYVWTVVTDAGAAPVGEEALDRA